MNGKLQMKGLVTTIAVAAAPSNATPARGTNMDLNTETSNPYGSETSRLAILRGIGENFGMCFWYSELAK